MHNNAAKKIFQLWIFRSWIPRILVLLLLSSVGAYYWLALPWVNKSISENYFKFTGHQLAHDKIQVHLFACNTSISNLKDSANLWSAKRISIDLACWQSIRQKALIVNSVAVQNLTVNATQDESGKWTFDEVLAHLNSLPKDPQSNTQKKDSLPVLINTVSLADAEINSNLRPLNNLQLKISPVDVLVNHIDLAQKSSLRFVLESKINTKTSLDVKGDIKLSDLSGNINADLKALPVVWAESIVRSVSELEILGGQINTTAQMSLKAGLPEKIQLNGQLASLKVKPTTMDQDVVKWKSLAWKDAVISMPEKSVTIPEMTLTEFDSQFIILKDRTTNIQAMLKKPTADSQVPPSSNGSVPKKVDSKTVAAAAPQNTAAPAPAPAPADAWKFYLQNFKVENAAIGFYDQSLTPSFMVIVQQFSGEIHQISNQPNQVADFKLLGNVDGYAPVNLEGTANLFIPQPQLAALFSFQKMDMGAFSPYSAEYAGWKIKKGLLSVDLNYRYEKGKIVGKNHVVIDHLEFGQKVRSPHLIDIPLRLGLYLLTDEKGIAVLDAEISGDPKDPKFNVKAVIWRAFTNTMKKIVTSPFRLLSSLIRSKEDLGQVSFTPGESQLTEKTIEKLKLLQQALAKRQQLKLSIKGTYDLDKDQMALREEQVKSHLRQLGVSQEDLVSQNATWAQKVAETYQAANLPNTTATPVQKYQELIQQEIVAPERLHQLAHERAQAVKQYFVLQLAMSSDLFLLDAEPECGKSNPCNKSDVIFTIDN